MNRNKMCLSMLYTLVHRELYLSCGILSPYGWHIQIKNKQYYIFSSKSVTFKQCTILVQPLETSITVCSLKFCSSYSGSSTLNKEHLSIKDKSTRPNYYYTSTF